MKIQDRFKVALNAFRQTNALGDDRRLARQFLRYGNRNPLQADWSQVVMNDSDAYTGFSYAAVNNRANAVVELAENNLITTATQKLIDEAKKKEEPLAHPYLPLIDESTEFANDVFWNNISIFLDLKGVFYLLAVRNFQGDRIGEIQEFKLLNPYEVKRIVNAKTGELGGYKEQRGNLEREIPKEMIIEIRKLNPFSRVDPYSLVDAAKDSQFTLKQAGDYTRHAIQKNINSPGIVTFNDEELAVDPEKFKNFQDRIKGHTKGEPIFAAGKGAIEFDPMQTNLGEAGLDKITEINLNQLIAVTGNSKTMFGIEQSGVTRDTGKIQKDLFTGSHAIPQLRTIISALNQDYKVSYPKDYEKTKYRLSIDSPLGVDREAELKDVEIRNSSFALFESLVAQGYDRKEASKYVNGEIALDELGEPKEPPKPEPETETETDNQHNHNHDHVEAITNQFDEDTQTMLNTQQAALQSTITNIEARLVAAVIDKVTKTKNDLTETEEETIITKSKRNESISELAVAIAAFYGIIMPVFGRATLNRRAKEFGKFGTFIVDKQVKDYIKKTANKAALGHIKTILNDMYKEVRELALAGKTQTEIISAIKDKYGSTISKVRAKTIARTETNRAFTMTQFQADIQFLNQNKLMGQAYKKWVTRSSNPCPICVSLASQPPIPFATNFAELGDELSATYSEDGKTKVLKTTVGFEDLAAGNAHPNCSCIYQLIIY